MAPTQDEVYEVRSQLVVTVVMKAFDGGLFDRAVHPFDLTIGPGMVGLGQPVLDSASPRLLEPVAQPCRDLAEHVEAHRPGADGVPVPRLFCELDSVVGENGVDLTGHGCEQVLKELPGCLSVGLVDELGHGELARAVDADEQI